MTQEQAFPCKLVDAQESGSIELERAGEIKRRSLEEICCAVFQIASTCDKKIKLSDKVKGKGMLTCSVCGDDVPLDFNIALKGFMHYESSIAEQCPNCNSTIKSQHLSS